MKKIIFICLTLIFVKSQGQSISVDTSIYTVPQLVEQVLFGNGIGGNNCAGTISNITWSTGLDFGSTSNGIGYFENTNPGFPLANGVILSTGDVENAPGPNTFTQSAGQFDAAWGTDQELFDYIDGLAIDPGLDSYENATILEFDFTPLTNQMSFDFLFASEEYGTFQCTYSDAFAFFLTDVTAGTAATNLALIPSTTTPISVVTIRDNAHNATCGSANPSFFGNFNGGAGAASAATNFNGETVLMTASASVIPGNVYHIKLVIADRNDGQYDSAVFLGGGSFNIGSPTITGTGEYDGISTIENVCSSEITVQVGQNAIPGVDYSWFLDGNPIGQNNNTLTTSQEGLYDVVITFPNGCTQEDSINVDFIEPLNLGIPNNLVSCSNIFNLTQNSALILNGSSTTISYHTTLTAAEQTASPIVNPANYSGLNGQIIYAAVVDDLTDCISTTSFQLVIDTCSPNITTPPDLYVYESSLNSGTANFNLTPQIPIILGLNSPLNYIVTFYTSSTDANNGNNPIVNIGSYSNTANPQTIFARLQSNNQISNFAVTSFQLIVVPLPTVAITATTPCFGNTATVTFTGTPNATVDYTVDGLPSQITLDTTGVFVLTTPPITTSLTYEIISVSITTVAGPTTQFVTDSTTITSSSAPIVTIPTDYIICDDSQNNDGLACFDLSTKINEITGGNPLLSVLFYETQTDAQIGATTFLPLNYCTISPGLQTLYVRVFFTGSPTCYSLTTLNLVVNPLPLANPVITDYALCDYTTPGDGEEVFILNSKTTEIANGQSNVAVTYHETEADAIAQVNPLPNNYTNTSSPQTIWINIRNTVTGCNTVSSFELIVNPLPVVVEPIIPISQCSNGATNQALSDLTVTQSTITSNPSNFLFTYYTSALAAQNGTNVGRILTPLSYLGTDNEVVHIRVEDVTTGCFSTTTQLLRVTQGPVAITPTPLEYCDPNNDGFGVFDLDSKIIEIAGGSLPPGVSVAFYETETDALIGATPSLTSPYPNIDPGTQTIYVRVFYDLTDCANYVQLQLIVHPTPEATTPSDYELCDYTGQVGFESFDLTTKESEILGAIDPALHTVSFYTTQALAEAGNTPPISNVTSYTNSTAWTQTLYVRVETIATGCYDVVELTLIVHPLPQATLPNYAPYTLCDYTGSIGFEVFDLSSKVSDILLGQTGMEVTFYPSLTAAQNGTNVITTPGAYQNVPIYVQTLGIRITNLTTGCYIVSTMDIRVIPLPTPLPPTSSLTYCDQDQDGVTCGIDLTALIPEILGSSTINYIITFHETQTTADLGVTDIPTPNDYCNIDPYSQTLYVRAEDALTGCYSVIPITFTIDPSPIAPVNIPNIVVCDQDSNPQDAITSVDLTVNTAMVLGQQPLAPSNYTITFYRTQPEAIAGVAPIIQTTSYTASNNEVIWMRVENNATGCFNLGSFSVIINTPLALTTPAPLSLCDDDAQPNNQFHVFDLTVRDNDINQGTGYQVAYYPSFPVTSSSVAIATPTSYQNTIAAVQTLGVMVTTTAGCISYTTLTIRVLPVPTPRDPSLATPERVLPGVCESVVNSGQGVVDLTLYESFIRNGDPNVTLIYYPSLADLQANTNAIATPQAALVGDPTLLNVAPPDRDPVDLVQYVYIAVSSNVYQDYTNRDCFKTVRQGFIINPLPEIAQLPLNNTYRICDPNPTIPPPALQTGVFDLTSQINGNPSLNNFGLIGAYQTDPGSTFTVTFYTDASLSAASLITTPTAFTNTSDPQIIYVSVVNNQTGCASTGQFNITVEDGAIANGPQEYTQCDNFGNLYDGVNEIDLITSFESAILGTQDPTIFTVSYYLSENDANGIPTNGNPPTPALTPAEAMAYQNTADTDVIWVKVENTSSTQPYCYALTPINIRVVRNPNPIIQTQNGITTICVNQNDIVVRDLTLDSGISNPQDYTFEWFEGTGTNTTLVGTGSTYTVSTAVIGGATRTYTVRVTTISPIPCSETSDPFDVIQSGPAWIPTGTVGYTVSNAFSDSQTITVTIDGYGTYEYSIDEGPRQTSNVFENVSLGEHIIYVWDTEGGIAYSCDALTIEGVQIIDYPYYFTPNGDGIHDKWNIVGLANQPSAKIYIFDRYGKLLKQISSTGEGWDGTFNGMLMPSTDYWFKVEYIEDNVIKEFKAHFSLKR
jgi:large repetitive protein